MLACRIPGSARKIFSSQASTVARLTSASAAHTMRARRTLLKRRMLTVQLFQTGRRHKKMADDNQVIENQKQILANQEKIETNQKQLLANQDKLEQILANQARMEENQKQILANQERILSK
jgi:hypothetical protein